MSGGLNIGAIEGTIRYKDEYSSPIDRAVSKLGGLDRAASAMGSSIAHASSHAGSSLHLIQEGVEKLAQVGGPATMEVAEGIAGISSKVQGLAALAPELGALLPVVVALAAGVGVLAVALKGLEVLSEIVIEGSATEVIVARLDQTLKSLGASAGLSSHEIIEEAEALARLSGQNTAAVISGEAILTRFTKIGHDVFPEASKAAIDLSRSGRGVEEAFTLVGTVMQGNARSLMQLKDMGIVFTAGQRKTLTTMIETGNVIGYQNIILQALREHVGGAAEAYGRTLQGGVSRAKIELEQAGEIIASRVIPILEDMISSLIDSVGGWEELHEKIVFIAHDIADKIAAVITTLAIFYHLTQLIGDEWTAFWAHDSYEFAKFESLFMSGMARMLEIAAFLPRKMGDKSWDAPIEAIRKYQKELVTTHSVAAFAAHADSVSEQAEIAKLVHSYDARRMALAGSDEVMKKHRSITDDVAKADKASAEILNTVASALRNYSAAIAEIIRQEAQRVSNQAALLGAANDNIAAYNREAQAQERVGAIQQEVAKITTKYTETREKLIEAQKKLEDAQKFSDAAEIIGKLEALDVQYKKLIADAALRTAVEFDLKKQTEDRLLVDRLDLESTSALRAARASLNDIIHQTTSYSREEAINEKVRIALATLSATATDAERVALEASIRVHERNIAALHSEGAATQQRIDFIRQLARATAESLDWQEQADAARKYGDSIARILQSYGLLSAASKTIALEERARAEFEAENHARTYAAILAELSAQQSMSDELARSAANREIFADSIKPMVDAYESAIDQMRGTVADFLTGQEVSWSDLAKSIERSLVNAALEVLQNWIKIELLKRAEIIRTAAIQRAANAAGGSSSIGSGASSAGGSVGTIFSGSGGAGGGASSAVGSQVGKYASAILIMYAAFVVYKVLFEKTDVAFGEMSVAGARASNSARYAAKAMALIENLIATTQDVAKQLGITLKDLGNITLGVYGSKTYVKDIEHNTSIAFDSMEAALDYARVRAIQLGDFAASVSAEVGAAIHDSIATTTAQLSADVEFARTLESRGMPEVSRTLTDSINSFVNNFHDEWTHAMALFGRDLSMLPTALTQVGAGLSAGFQSLYNQYTGHVESVVEQQQQIATIFNARLVMARADIAVQIATIHAMIERIRAGSLLNGSIIDSGEVIVSVAQYITKAAESAASTLRVGLLEGLLAQEAALQAILDDLNKIPTLNPGDVKLPGAGGGAGAGSTTQSIMDAVHDAQRQRELDLMTALDRAIAEVNKKWDDEIGKTGLHSNALALATKRHDDAIKAAHGNAAAIKAADEAYQRATRHIHDSQQAIAAANREREIEIALIKERNKTDVAQRFAEMVRGNDPFASMHENFSTMRADINDAGYGAARTANMLARLAAAEDKATKLLSDQLTAGLLGDLAGYITDATIHADLLRQQEIINFQEKLFEMQTTYALLKDQGKLSAETRAIFEKAFGWIHDHAADLPGGANWTPSGGGDTGAVGTVPGGDGQGGHWVPNGHGGWTWQPDASNDNNTAQSARDKLASYLDDGLDPLTRSLRKIYDDFNSIEAALGRTPEILEARADAIQRALDDFLSPIRDLQHNLMFGDQSPFDAVAQYQQAQADFMAAQAQFAAGDLSVVSDVPDLIQRLLSLAQQVTPTGSQAYTDIFAQANAFLNQILALTPNSAALAALGSSANPMQVNGMNDLTAVNEAQLDNVISMRLFMERTTTAIESIDRKTIAGGGHAGVA